MTTGNGLAGWTVQVFGPTTASVVTDANGNYAFAGLTDGATYTVCEVVQVGWAQVSPTFPAACGSGMGYSFVISGGTASFINFGNQPL